MRPAKNYTDQSDLFRARLSSQINPNHPLILLSETIDWDFFEQEFEKLYTAEKGQPPKPIRLIIGLFMLQHVYQLSDERVVAYWVENPYWQYFCGYEFLENNQPLDPSSLVRWRKRIGTTGMETILAYFTKFALQHGIIEKSSLKEIIADTTVMEKNVAYPTDAFLLNRAREKLVRRAKQLGLKLRQTYERIGKSVALKVHRYAHAKQQNRMKEGIAELKNYLRRVIKDIKRKATNANIALCTNAQSLIGISEKVLVQERTSKNKIYSIHEPTTVCISKGKARNRYEFGKKVSIVVTHKEGFVLHAKALSGNPYDGHTLADSLTESEFQSQTIIEKVYVDKGYRGHGITSKKIYHSGQINNKRLSKKEKKALKRRSMIEARISEFKRCGRLARNYLHKHIGDELNAILCGIGHNLRFIMRKLCLDSAPKPIFGS